MLQNVVIERFGSITEFLNTCENKTNRAGKNAESKTAESNWAGTSSLRNANELLLFGDKKTWEKMVELPMKQVQSFVAKSKIKRDIVGFAPCVPAALCGVPNAMYQIHKVKQLTPRLELWYSPTCAGHISAESLQKAGVIMLSIVNSLERRGVSVSLNIVNKCSIHNKREATICCVNVKKAGQPLDGLKAAYCIANPSFFRRHGFLWYETCEKIQNPDFFGYGQTIQNCEEVVKILTENGVNMSQTLFINFYKIKELEFDTQAVMRYLNIE